jgi:hypothetical protein
LGCCKIGEHVVDTHGFPPCRSPPNILYFWEEAKVKRHIDAFVKLGKMKPNTSKYAYRVTLLVKKDGSCHFYGDCKPLNLQRHLDVFLMPLVEGVINWLGKFQWFYALDV